jgi:hypothetical protein
MNLNKNILLALGLLAASASHAQITPADATATGYGLLGHRYTELNTGLRDITHVSEHGYHVGAAANNPLIPGVLDAGASYSYSWIRGAFRGHANTIGAYTTAYTVFKSVKPFVNAGLGYEWNSFGFGTSDDRTLWGLAAGLEIPAGAVIITPRVSYTDDFEGSRTSIEAWTLQVEGNYWYSATQAVFASIGKTDIRRGPNDAWNYEIGLRARF